jgi:hydroxyacylglutathione hydrolase
MPSSVESVKSAAEGHIMTRNLKWFLAAAAFAMVAAGNAEAGLKKLELSSDIAPVIRFDPAFSPSVRDYTVAVHSPNAKSIRIIPTAASDQDTVRINGMKVDSGKPYNAELQPGDNKFAISVSSADREDASYTLTVIRKDLSGEYRSEVVQRGIWRIADLAGYPPCEDMYLIEGAGKAILIDAGMGKGNLAQYVKGLTSLPIEIAVTHGHGDHVGQLNQFPGATVYMSEKDKTMLPAALVTDNFRWVKDGDRIDLGGGRQLEVIEVPGHTAGSIMFLDKAAKVLAVGDAIGSGMYVWKFTGTSSLSEYRDTLEQLEKRLAPFDALTFLVGHHWQERTPLSGASGKRMVTDMRILCEQIISGEIAGTPTSTSIGPRKLNIRTAEYGLAGLWYDPANIKSAE